MHVFAQKIDARVMLQGQDSCENEGLDCSPFHQKGVPLSITLQYLGRSLPQVIKGLNASDALGGDLLHPLRNH